MTSAVAKMVSKRLLSESAQNKFGREDPYFEELPATDLNGNPKPNSKPKRVKKRINAAIPEPDREVLTKVKRRAYRLDNCISICGIKFGWSSILGFIPAAGDFLDLFMALMVLNTAMKVSPGKDRDMLRGKMMMNIIVDFFIGLVPLLGDIADTFFRANTRNAVALEKMLEERVKRQAGSASGRGTQRIETGSSEKRSASQHRESDERRQEPIAMPPRAKSATRAARDYMGRGGSRERDLERGEGQVPMRQSRR